MLGKALPFAYCEVVGVRLKTGACSMHVYSRSNFQLSQQSSALSALSVRTLLASSSVLSRNREKIDGTSCSGSFLAISKMPKLGHGCHCPGAEGYVLLLFRRKLSGLVCSCNDIATGLSQRRFKYMQLQNNFLKRI